MTPSLFPSSLSNPQICFEDPTVGLAETEAVALVDCKKVASTGFSLFQDRIIISTSSQTSLPETLADA